MARQPVVIPLRQRALRLLAAREHSRVELSRKLAPHAESPEELEALLDDLEQRKQLSNTRYAEARSNLMSRKFGSARIAYDLRSKGVSDDEAQQAIASARDSDLQRAREVWRRKYRTPPESKEERARHMRFLQSRGFSFDVIRQVLAGDPDEE
jgi:regulatory protein